MVEKTLTLPQIARDAGVSERLADYRVRCAGIEPSGRVGIIRVYSSAQAEQIKRLVTEPRKAAQHA